MGLYPQTFRTLVCTAAVVVGAAREKFLGKRSGELDGIPTE